MKLAQEARKGCDDALADLIMLGAYTGARIEELCSLKARHVALLDKTLVIPRTKTDAAVRTVPTHSAIQALLAWLVEKAKDGWLVPSNAANRFDERSASLSKRFGRLKTKPIFPPLHFGCAENGGILRF
jgi:integrase